MITCVSTGNKSVSTGNKTDGFQHEIFSVQTGVKSPEVCEQSGFYHNPRNDK